MKTVGVNQPHVANDKLQSDQPASHHLANGQLSDGGIASDMVVDEPQLCVDESAVSKEAVGSNGHAVSALEAVASIGHAVSALEASDSDASASVKDEELSTNADCRDADRNAPSKSAETNSDESIISTADLRDVFNRLEVIVQKLARGGAVW